MLKVERMNLLWCKSFKNTTLSTIEMQLVKSISEKQSQNIEQSTITTIYNYTNLETPND
jgi:hypothetical protein